MRYLPLLMLTAFAAPLAAQTPPHAAPSPQAQQMQKLDFLVGTWQGSGYVEFVPGQRHTFTETELIQPKLNGLVLLIEGTGESKLPDGREIVTHSALATISYDDQRHAFLWNAYSLAGSSVQYVRTTAEVGQDTLQWGFAAGRAGNFQFTIRLDKQGQWLETGTISHPGKAAQKFFEMRLHRVE